MFLLAMLAQSAHKSTQYSIYTLSIQATNVWKPNQPIFREMNPFCMGFDPKSMRARF